MQIQINPGQGVAVSEALDSHISERLERLGRRFGDRLTRIEVHLVDVNGPKGGVNKQVKMEARPRGLEPLLAEAMAESAYDAVSGAAARLEKVIASRFGKQENRRGRVPEEPED